MPNSHELYQKALSVLTSQGKFYINLGLERVQQLLELYNNPQDKIKCIHVAGTNGKGSTCAMLASVLSHAGYKTGLYTSPHLVEYTERVKINGKDISQDDFADLIFDIINIAEQNNIHVTEFEILTVLGFIYFEREKIDFAVIETGLGGRLDATNIIKPLVSIITTIDSDHTDRLGDTVEKIAFEKAGIIKPGTPVITLKNNKGLEIIKAKALESNSKLILADDEICRDYETNLSGLWQKTNLSLVLESVKLLRNQGFAISETDLKKGLQNVSWPARFQYIEKMNLILDGAHNPNAAKLLRESLDVYYPDKEKIWIYSSINTKDYKEVMEILFRPADIIILTKSNSAAAVSPEILKEELLSKNSACQIYTTKNIKESVNTYLRIKTTKNTGILTGSLYSTGDFLTEYGNNKNLYRLN